MSESSEDARKEFARRVERAEDYDQIFDLVKRAIENTLHEHRAGLSLVLTDMPNSIGAFYPAWSNYIVVNRALIEEMKRVVKDLRELNAFVFVILMHEYLHSLGHLDDDEVRRISKSVCSETVGPEHPATKYADSNWLEMFPQLSQTGRPFSKFYRTVEKFDSSSTPYLG
ncbi:MAG: hypothetical protein JRN68_10900 [Nitrososphaerota archaeon]|jgi:hypothetical protein|nr:hypothetical protein [Nitrososphaerota archaeon]